jgi:hypothetical protein
MRGNRGSLSSRGFAALLSFPLLGLPESFLQATIRGQGNKVAAGVNPAAQATPGHL